MTRLTFRRFVAALASLALFSPQLWAVWLMVEIQEENQFRLAISQIKIIGVVRAEPPLETKNWGCWASWSIRRSSRTIKSSMLHSKTTRRVTCHISPTCTIPQYKILTNRLTSFSQMLQLFKAWTKQISAPTRSWISKICEARPSLTRTKDT